jgi:hypothetical protein
MATKAKDALELAGDIFDEKQEEVQDAKRNRQLRYLLIQFGLQIFCAVFVTLGILWGAIQFMRVWQVFGISDLPPGVKFAPELD